LESIFVIHLAITVGQKEGGLAKRLFDLGFALVLLPFLLPVMALVCLAILMLDGRPVLFAGERMCAPDRAFTLWKFRTMRPGGGDGFATGGDKLGRITPLGDILRRTRLDELPQLFHILSGKMSFVGPRPPLRRYVCERPDLYAHVLRCKPGVTGLATLRFHAREARMLAACRTVGESDRVYRLHCLPAKARLDLFYARKRSLCLDIAIIAATVGSVLRSEGFRGLTRR